MADEGQKGEGALASDSGAAGHEEAYDDYDEYDYDEAGMGGGPPGGWVEGDTHHIPEGSQFECKQLS